MNNFGTVAGSVLLMATLRFAGPCLLVLAIHATAAAPAPVFAEHGMVVSSSEPASRAGVEILKLGGNAVDAAVATGFALAVVHPAAGNIGGGGFMVSATAAGHVFTLDFREKAPRAARRDMFLDAEGDVIPGASLRTPLASGVPGSVDGLLRAWRDHGSGNISRGALLAPAIGLAKDGFPLSRGLARAFNARREAFAKDRGAGQIFVRRDGRAWHTGDLFTQRDLADTLARIARDGREGFYGGRAARRFATFMKKAGGLITEEDLANYRSAYRPPIRASLYGREIVSMGPPSSGGILLVQMLRMLEPYPLAEMGWNSSAYVHLLTEAQRRAYADRAEHLGDADFWDVPLAGLTSRAYARARASDIALDRATPSEEIKAGKPLAEESEETTHYSVVDGSGNAVAVTTTLNGGYGSGIVVEGLGFFLNNEMDDFSLKPGSPNLYGLLGNEANAIEPGKRMLSSMTPAIVLSEGKPSLVVGSPGGSTIITTVLQVVLNVVVHGMDVQEAVAAPRHHSQWMPDVIRSEPWGLVADVRKRLEAMGHTLSPPRGLIGDANSIAIGPEGFYGAPDPRHAGSAAAGY